MGAKTANSCNQTMVATLTLIVVVMVNFEEWGRRTKDKPVMIADALTVIEAD
jgi:hypothetical protein